MCKKFWFPFSLSVFVCMCLSNANASICFLPDCQDKGIMNGDINMDINNATRWCEKKGFTYYSSGQCPEYYKKVETCKRDSNYLKCDAQAWCKDNGYNTTTCSLPNFIDQQCPNGLPLYKGCKEDTARACKQIGYTNTCPSGQKLKANTGRCSWNNSYGTCCSPSGCPANSSLNSSSYGIAGTDGCEYNCYYTCNMNCPSGTSTSNPGGCGGSTRNQCGNKTCYYPYQSCCSPNCSSEWGCSCGSYSISDGCGGSCNRCSSCCSHSTHVSCSYGCASSCPCDGSCSSCVSGDSVKSCSTRATVSSEGNCQEDYAPTYYLICNLHVTRTKVYYSGKVETSSGTTYSRHRSFSDLGACRSVRQSYSCYDDGYRWPYNC